MTAPELSGRQKFSRVIGFRRPSRAIVLLGASWTVFTLSLTVPGILLEVESLLNNIAPEIGMESTRGVILPISIPNWA